MGAYLVESKKFDPLLGVHGGTGRIEGSANLIKPSSVTGDPSALLDTAFWPFAINVMSAEIATPEAPNWFGVSYPTAISNFETVHIFCHPSPGTAHMVDSDYPGRCGNWRKLFRYAEIFGRQMSHAKANDYVTIIPFFTNASYSTGGIFGKFWKEIVEQILILVRAQVKGLHVLVVEPNILKGHRPTPAPPSSSDMLKNVILSDFSYGRTLMWNLRQQMVGLPNYLREVWDFDGVHAPTPSFAMGVKAMVYNQASAKASNSFTFPVPSPRWINYHHVRDTNVHGDIPAFMACHAAWCSSVGKAIRIASRNFLTICLTRFITFSGAFRVTAHVFR